MIQAAPGPVSSAGSATPASEGDPAVEHDRAAAITAAIAAARPDDVVLIAGKGHETTQQTGDTRRAFDDRVVARTALEAL